MSLASRFRVRRKLHLLWTFTTDERHARHTNRKSGLSPTLLVILYGIVYTYDNTHALELQAFFGSLLCLQEFCIARRGCFSIPDDSIHQKFSAFYGQASR